MKDENRMSPLLGRQLDQAAQLSSPYCAIFLPRQRPILHQSVLQVPGRVTLHVLRCLESGIFSSLQGGILFLLWNSIRSILAKEPLCS